MVQCQGVVTAGGVEVADLAAEISQRCGKSKKPLINRGFSWCPSGDLNPHAR
jgi:hypothetical protein